MHLVDITMFYAPTSGGVRTYLDCKHSYLTRQVGVRHSVLVPAGIDAPDADFHCLGAAPLGTTGYRFRCAAVPGCVPFAGCSRT